MDDNLNKPQTFGRRNNTTQIRLIFRKLEKTVSGIPRISLRIICGKVQSIDIRMNGVILNTKSIYKIRRELSLQVSKIRLISFFQSSTYPYPK